MTDTTPKPHATPPRQSPAGGAPASKHGMKRGGRMRAAATTPPTVGGPPPPLQIEVHHDDATTVVLLRGELDVATAEPLRGHIYTALTEHDPHRFVVDLTDLTFTDSSGLGILIWADRLLNRRGRRLQLCNPRGQVLRVLHITGLHTRLHITDSTAPDPH
jgi:anti-anti-sigma factor